MSERLGALATERPAPALVSTGLHDTMRAVVEHDHTAVAQPAVGGAGAAQRERQREGERGRRPVAGGHDLGRQRSVDEAAGALARGDDSGR